MALPPASVLLKVAEISINEDRPIYLDYYKESLEKKCCIGVQGTTKYLIKSAQEYTSTIQSYVKCDTCYIITTENSLYIVDKDIPVKRILGSSEDKGQ